MCRLCRASGYGGGYGFGLYGGYGGGGLNRASWREKSDAATRREDLAKKTFNEKLATLANDTDTIRAFQHYPKQQLLVSGLIEPQVHLTGPCWKTFKQHVIAKQCSVRRRVATPTEKAEARRTQKGKCYWMDVTFSLSALELWRRTYLGLASTSSSSSSSSSSFAGVEEVEHVSLTDVLKKRAKEQGVIDLTLFDNNSNTNNATTNIDTAKETVLVTSPSSDTDVVPILPVVSSKVPTTTSFRRRAAKGTNVSLSMNVSAAIVVPVTNIQSRKRPAPSSSSSSSSSSSLNKRPRSAPRRATTATASSSTSTTPFVAAVTENPPLMQIGCKWKLNSKVCSCKKWHCMYCGFASNQKNECAKDGARHGTACQRFISVA